MKHVFISTIRNNNNNNNKPTGTITTGKHMTSGDDSVNRLRQTEKAEPMGGKATNGSPRKGVTNLKRESRATHFNGGERTVRKQKLL